MDKHSIAEAMRSGLTHQQAGRLAEAEQIYTQILQADPNVPSAWHFLGLIVMQQGKLDAAIRQIGRAVELCPDYAEAQSDLGNCLDQQQRYKEASACYLTALALKPNLASAHFNLANLLKKQGELTQAVHHFQRAIESNPEFAAAYHHLGDAFQELGQLDSAVSQYRRALLLVPNWPEGHCKLGLILIGLGKVDEAIACFQQALALQPDYAAAHHNLASAFSVAGKYELALSHYRQAITFDQGLAEAYAGAGVTLHMLDRADEALEYYEKALRCNPGLAEVHNNLGTVLRDQARCDEAVACFKRAWQLQPDYFAAHFNYLYSLYFAPGCSSARICQEHQAWNDRFVLPRVSAMHSHTNDRTPDRRLRVGYFSPDFRNHCLSFFMAPLFRSHDRRQVELICYSDVLCPDETTAGLRSFADGWRDIAGHSDDEVAAYVRQDGIDILVDLAMLMERGRPFLFARKPAPVQVAWLAYPGTTGLTAIDYRLTDPYLDPPGEHDAFYSEKSMRLPNSFWCYDPLGYPPVVGPLPAERNGYITFGSLNNYCKVNAPTLTLWASVLRMVERSRLLLLAPEGSCRKRALDLLGEQGVSADRISFVGRQPVSQYFQLYNSIDISLDTLPYNGHTTSLDSLFMGVPVVTLVGPTVVGRAGLSQLTNLELTDLVTWQPDDFVSVAVALAFDLSRLQELRSTLRQRMQQSPLMDAPRFAQNIETVYRSVWLQWCASS